VSNASIEVIGESVVDCVERRDGTVTTHPGGSAANVAFGLARLGREVAFLTQLGADSHGALMRRHLEGVGVRLGRSGDVAARTPSAGAQLDASGAAPYDLDVDWRLPLDTAAVGHHHLHLGSFAAFLGSAPADVEAVLAKAHAAATTSFDPNIRPALLPAQHRSRRATRTSRGSTPTSRRSTSSRGG